MGYALDKSNAKAFGVCAGLARTTGWSPFAVRLTTVLATVLLLGPAAIFAYLLVAALAEAH